MLSTDEDWPVWIYDGRTALGYLVSSKKATVKAFTPDDVQIGIFSSDAEAKTAILRRRQKDEAG